MIDTDNLTLSIRRQCELVGLNRSTFYWEPVGESLFNTSASLSAGSAANAAG
jgi:hypothetical protein